MCGAMPPLQTTVSSRRPSRSSPVSLRCGVARRSRLIGTASCVPPRKYADPCLVLYAHTCIVCVRACVCTSARLCGFVCVYVSFLKSNVVLWCLRCTRADCMVCLPPPPSFEHNLPLVHTCDIGHAGANCIRLSTASPPPMGHGFPSPSGGVLPGPHHSRHLLAPQGVSQRSGVRWFAQTLQSPGGGLKEASPEMLISFPRFTKLRDVHRPKKNNDSLEPLFLDPAGSGWFQCTK